MKTTTLGRTCLEHMEGQPQDTVVATIRRAIEHGVYYFYAHEENINGYRGNRGRCTPSRLW